MTTNEESRRESDPAAIQRKSNFNTSSTLSPEHLAQLAASGITAEHANKRGCATIRDPRRLAQLGIAKGGQRTQGLLVPMLRADGSTWGHQYRPDHPRERSGDVVKYETPTGQRNGIDVPPGVGPMLGDPSVTLWVTEGVKKADAAALQGLCVVALPGVWGWRGTNGDGGKMAVGDWHDIALNGRRVVLAFDSDVTRKPAVQKALRELAKYLESKGARVEILRLPDADEKVGLDDYLVDHDVADLEQLVEPTPAPAVKPTKLFRPSDPSVYFSREGLLARDLADDVMRMVTCGYGAADQRLYVYEHGVWRPDDGRINAGIATTLGNRYRKAHATNVIDLIKYTPGIPRISREPMPAYINVRNGMIDWRTGKLLPHKPEYCSTVQLPVAYDPHAKCPKFDTFLAQVLPEDCIDFIWELIAYTIYSGNPFHNAVLLFGKGRNGKGTLIRLLKRLLGDHNTASVTLYELVDNRFRAATLYGKLANLAGDLDGRWLENTAKFKSLTGGDEIQGEIKHGAIFDFKPWALPFYSMNKPFSSADSSEGWWARWVIVPFPNSFIGKEDRQLDDDLQTDAELSGVLAHAIRVLPVVMKRGRLLEPKSVRDAKKQFIASSDTLRYFVDENCELDPEAWTERGALYRAYAVHAADSGSKVMSNREFYNRVEQINGVDGRNRSYGRGFAGIRLIGQPVTPVTDMTGTLTATPARTGKAVENLSQVSLLPPSFTPPTGEGRCNCGFHVPTQGHRNGCTANARER